MNMLEALRDLGTRAGIPDTSRMTMTEVLIAAAALPEGALFDPDGETIGINEDTGKAEVINGLRAVNIAVDEDLNSIILPDASAHYRVTFNVASFVTVYVQQPAAQRRIVIEYVGNLKGDNTFTVDTEDYGFPTNGNMVNFITLSLGQFVELQSHGNSGWITGRDINSYGGLVALDHDGYLPVLNGANLTNVPAVIDDYSIVGSKLASNIDINTTGNIYASIFYAATGVDAPIFSCGGSAGVNADLEDILAEPSLYQVRGGIITLV